MRILVLFSEVNESKEILTNMMINMLVMSESNNISTQILDNEDTKALITMQFELG